MSISINIPTNCGNIGQKFFSRPEIPSCPADITHGHIPFVHRLFCEWSYTPLLDFSWVIVIEAHNKDYLLGRLNSSMKKLEGSEWGIGRIVTDTWTEQTQETVGCIFAQAVEIPGEKADIDYAGISTGGKRGFINAPFSKGRQNFSNLQIMFLDTNQSFTDGVLRPWTILAMHEGLLARPKDKSIKADIHVYQLAKAGTTTPNVITKSWTYRNCVPVEISKDDLKYDGTSIIKRQAYFTYTTYDLNQEPQSSC